MRATPHHVDLTVCDVDKSVAFYDRVLVRLGYHRVAVTEGEAPCWEIGPDDALATAFGIALHRARSSTAHDRYTAGLHHLAFTAASRDEVDAFHRFLTDEQIEVLDPPAEYDYTPGYYAVFFADPDGLKLELVHAP